MPTILTQTTVIQEHTKLIKTQQSINVLFSLDVNAFVGSCY